MAASKYFTLFPCEFWSLENFFSCVTFNANEGDEDHLDKIYHAFYSALGTIKSNSPEIYNKIEKLQQSTKKADTNKRVSKFWKQQNTLKDVTNVVCNERCGENTTSSVPTKKRKFNNRDTILQQSQKDNSLQQQDYIELPLSEIPKPVREYLTKNQRPDSKSAEDVVQTWFNGLMKVSSSAWKSVTAVDTHKMLILEDICRILVF
ncbi:hypothetical protein RhiirC2_785881 [Rhizophagus irregularis]|uniref:Uncharacterized protein n=1 Tax=Rhizophagus irregularis TaxID=588596 RepID=A0A2N1MVF3_9GLOM|nr:hypothetical protein RhiirC2_785881 [Rhizophagus irregularis]